MATKMQHSKSLEYHSWQSMKARCLNPNSDSYPRYGGRGIKICDRWIASFADFLADMGPRPSRHFSLGRIDNDGHYEPGNCRWETHLEQANNTSRNVFLEVDGERKTVSQWAVAAGSNHNKIAARMRTGWPVSEAIEAPDRTCSLIHHDGETHSITEWARLKGMHKATLAYRLRSGWSVERSLTTPPPDWHKKSPKGPRTNRARLNKSQAIEISSRLSAGETLNALAEEFHVHPATIQDIRAGRTWSHITGRGSNVVVAQSA